MRIFLLRDLELRLRLLLLSWLFVVRCSAMLADRRLALLEEGTCRYVKLGGSYLNEQFTTTNKQIQEQEQGSEDSQRTFVCFSDA